MLAPVCVSAATVLLPEWASHGVGRGGSAPSQSCHCITTGAPPRCRRDRITPAWGAGVATWPAPCPGTTHDESLVTIPAIREVERSVIQTHVAFPDHQGRCWHLPFRVFSFPSPYNYLWQRQSWVLRPSVPAALPTATPGPRTWASHHAPLAGSTHLPVLGLALWRLQGVRMSSRCLDCTGFYPVNSLEVRCRWND